MQNFTSRLRCVQTAAVFLAGLIFLHHAPRLSAQVLYGTLLGTVADESGGIVPGAQVTIINHGTGQSRELAVNESGLYSFQNVAPGSYDLTVTATGFRGYTQQNLSVTANTVTRVDVRLEVGQVTETVTVEANAAALQTDKADVNVEIGSKEVTNLPLPRYRNYQSLINLVPGATPARFQNTNTIQPARSLSTNVNGTNRNNNATRVDGAINIFIWQPQHTAYVPSAETIETVNISTNNFDAEQGMAGGAAITVVTKSGTNEFHGSAFAFHQNSALAAKDYFFDEPKTPKSIINIDGFTAGGPIKKNKLFFFGAWEGTRERINFNRLFTVPTNSQKAGDFSTLRTTLYDPATGSANGSGRTQFANNVVPADRQSGIAQKLQGMIPEANRPGTNNNYFASGGEYTNRDQFDIKINYQRSDTHSIWGKYSAMDAQIGGPYGLGAAGGPCLCSGFAGRGDTLVQVATIGHTKTFSPTFLWDAVIGWTNMGQVGETPLQDTNVGLDVLGIPGTNNNGRDFPLYGGFPLFTIASYSGIGDTLTSASSTRNDSSITMANNFTYLKGSHEIRFGFEGARHHLNHFQPGGDGPSGGFNFNTGVTSAQGAAGNQFNAYAAFLMGLPQYVGASLQAVKPTGYVYNWGGYIRDRWQVNPKLTLSLGIRYELYPMMTRSGRGGIEQYDPATNTMQLGGNGDLPKDLGIGVSHKLFSPRVGFAYRATENMVVRGGYGITTNPMPIVRPLRGFYPLTLRSRWESPNQFQPFATLEQGIPEIVVPDLNAPVIPVTISDIATHIVGNEIRRGYIQSWNFIIENRLPANFITSIGYVGTMTVRSFGNYDYNAAAPGTGRNGRPLWAEFGRTGQTNFFAGQYGANYHSLQFTINRQVASGLTLKGAYTFSKAISETDDDGQEGVLFNYLPAFYRNRSQAGYNIPHVFQLGYVYELPFGKGRSYLTNGFGNWLLGGWQINGVFAAYQGAPFTVMASGQALNAPGNTQTADQVKLDVEKIGSPEEFYDKTAFAPVTRATGTLADFGTSGRNLMRGPGMVNVDLSLFRDFTLTEQFKLQFRAESFNLTNSPHFAAPDASVNSASFMAINATNENAPNRQIRFGLRLVW